VPVTVKLSKRFYDTFGEEIANEFVEWFNLVDTTYRSEIRELFGANFGRFDAKLEQRTAELRAEIGQRSTEVRAELREGLALLEGRLVARMGLSESRLVRWMFVFWAASVGTSIALIQLTR
jgi:hypothetical protein